MMPLPNAVEAQLGDSSRVELEAWQAVAGRMVSFPRSNLHRPDRVVTLDRIAAVSRRTSTD
jgi:hypothetical protein